MYGNRGSILAHFGWTWQYLLWGIRWNIVQKMLIDAASYDYKKTKEPEKKKTQSLRDMMNSIPR